MKSDLEYTLSASKIKTLKSCSLKYHAQYVTKLPQKSNVGNRIGDCTHIVLELLADRRHRTLLEALQKAKALVECGAIERYVKKYIKKESLPTEAYDKIEKFLLLAVKEDFLCEGSTFLGAEIKFDITSENPLYRITGFMDQVAEYKDKWIRIRDWKTQKVVMKGDDQDNNLQSLIYSLAAKALYGQDKKAVVDFLMLNFPKDVLFRVQNPEDKLEGFKYYLADMYEKVATFSDKDMWENVAADKYPDKDGSFSGKLQCGWNWKGGFMQSPDQKKKDGSPAYYCAYRFGFDYFALCNSSDETVRTAFTKEELKADEKKGEYIIPRKYSGCPAFNRP